MKHLQLASSSVDTELKVMMSVLRPSSPVPRPQSLITRPSSLDSSAANCLQCRSAMHVHWYAYASKLRTVLYSAWGGFDLIKR